MEGVKSVCVCVRVRVCEKNRENEYSHDICRLKTDGTREKESRRGVNTSRM